MRRGFTLIEMAVVLVILGLVFAGATSIALPVFTSEKADLTLARMSRVQQAIQLYVIQYGCLPCPAAATARSSVSGDNPGLSQDSSGVYGSGVYCTSNACYATAGTAGGGGTHGMVPWITLGISEEDAVDGWNHRIRYDVASGGTPCSGGTAGLQRANGMVRCAIGAAQAYPAGNMTVTDNDSSSAGSSAAYVLVSSGADGAMAFNKGTGTYTGDRYSQEALTTGQGQNYIGGAAGFYYGSFNSTSGTSHFDDIVRTTTAPVIIQKCGANGCGNPA